MKTKKIAMIVCSMLILSCLSVFVHAEMTNLGKVNVLGIESGDTIRFTNEAWLKDVDPNANSLDQHFWSFNTKEEQFLMISTLTTLVLKNKTLYKVESWNDKSAINTKAKPQFEVFLMVFDTGVTGIMFWDRKTGLGGRYLFK